MDTNRYRITLNFDKSGHFNAKKVTMDFASLIQILPPQPYRVDVTDFSYIHLFFMLRLCCETVFDIILLTLKNRGDSMLAIIRKGNGEYYTSLVFGYYSDNASFEDDYQRHLNSIYNRFYLVLDESKTKLIKQVVFDRNNKYLIPLVLIVDHSTDDWTMDENGNGCVNYLDYAALLAAVDDNSIPDEVISRCVSEDSKIKYQEYHTVETQKDLEDLDWASGNFHDAYIKDFKEGNDSLYILFDGTWGCQIELWFDGNVSYSIESRDPKTEDPYWMGSTLIMKDGYFILVDCEDTTEEQIGEGYCWFKGNKLKYHIIPD